MVLLSKTVASLLQKRSMVNEAFLGENLVKVTGGVASIYLMILLADWQGTGQQHQPAQPQMSTGLRKLSRI
jgi:aryl carrier-like protein